MENSQERTNNMAEEGRNVEAFLRYIPTQLDEARRNLHSDNTNVLEFIQRRLEDSLHVLNVLVRRCTYLQIDECDNLLRHLISEVQQMDRQYDDLNSQSRILSENRFCCPREDSVRGRPRYSIPNSVLNYIQSARRSDL
jgi:hypothetical protein